MEELNKQHDYNSNSSESATDRFNKIETQRIRLVNQTKIEKETFTNMKDFNNKFQEQIVELNEPPQELSSLDYMVDEKYSSLHDLDKLYVDDSILSSKFTSLDKAFIIQSVSNIDIPTNTVEEKMINYKKQTNKINNKIGELNKQYYSNSSESPIYRIICEDQIKIEKETFKNMKEFNNKFDSNKLDGGKFQEQIIKFDGPLLELSSNIVNDEYINLDDLDKLYVDDSIWSSKFTSLDKAFMIQPLSHSNGPNDTDEEKNNNNKKRTEQFNDRIEQLNRIHDYFPESPIDVFNNIETRRNTFNDQTKIKKEIFKNMEEFNDKFNDKFNEKFQEQIIEFNGPPQELSSMCDEEYTKLCNLDKLYMNDYISNSKFTSLDKAYTVQPISNIDVPINTIEERMDNYKKHTDTLYNIIEQLNNTYGYNNNFLESATYN